MLAEITLDGKYLWSSDSMANDLIIPQSLKVEYNKAGSFSFVMLPTHPEYDNIHRMKSYVRVSIDDYEVFRGRVLDFSCDFYRRKTVTCEGDLAFLLDSIYPAIKTTSSVTPDVFFGFLIAEHNRQMERDSGSEFKKLTVGNVSVSTEMDQASPETFDNPSPRSTSDVIDDLLISKYGGFLITRLGPQSHITGEVFVDYISDREWPAETGQNGDIAFGVNLLNLEYEPPIEEVFTAVMPVGYNKLTLSETFVVDNTAIQKYGFIAKTVSFEDCTTESKLRSEAQKYLAKYTKAYPDTLTVKAVDLVHLGQANRGIRLGDKVAVSSDPHGIEYDGSNAEKTVRCLAIEYDLTNPSNNTYVLGTYIPPDKKRKAPNVARSGGSARRVSYSGSNFSGLGNTTFSGLQAPAMTEMIDKAKSTITSLSDEGGSWISGLADKAYGKLKEVFGGTNGLDTGTLWDFVSGGVNDLKAGIGNTVSNLTSGAGGDMLNNGFEGLKSGLESITGGATLSSKAAENAGLRETLTETKAELIEKHEDNAVNISTANGRITAEVTRATEAEGSLSSRITVEAGKIQLEVERATAAEGTLSSRITQTDASIEAEVTRATAAEGNLSSRITQTDASIEAEVTRATAAEGTLSSRITQTDASIEAEVTRATAAEGTLSSRITQTDESIEAEVTRATGAEDSLSSRITVEAGKIQIEVERATAAEGNLSSRITQTDESIEAEVTRATEAEGSLSSRITVEAGRITSEVTRATSAEENLSSRITQTEENIELKVSKTDYNGNTISSLINQNATSILIQAEKINLEGYVTASSIAADRAYINSIATSGGSQIQNGKIFATSVIAGSVNVTNFAITNESGLIVTDRSGVSHTIADTGHYHHFRENADGTISITTATDTAGNFNIAATNKYKTDVAAAKASIVVDSWGWNDSPDYDQANNRYTMYPMVVLTNNNVGRSTGITFIPTEAYNKGHADGLDDVYVLDISQQGRNPSYDSQTNQYTVPFEVSLSSGTNSYVGQVYVVATAAKNAVDFDGVIFDDTVGNYGAYKIYLDNGKERVQSASSAWSYSRRSITASDIYVTSATVSSTGLFRILLNVYGRYGYENDMLVEWQNPNY